MSNGYAKNASSPLNSNKVIKIKRSADTSSVVGKSWRTAYSDVLSSIHGDSGKTSYHTWNASDTDVADEIELLLEEKIPDIMYKNKYTGIMQSLNDTISGVTGGKAKNINDFIGRASSIASLATSIGSSVYDKATVKDLSTARVFDPWISNAIGWQSGDDQVISFEYDFKFRLGQYGLWNATEEVFKPILNLAVPAMPQYISNFFRSGNMPTVSQLVLGSLMELVSQVYNGVKGLTGKISDWWNNEDSSVIQEATSDASWSESLSSAISKILLDEYDKFAWDISFGKTLTIKRCYVKDARVSFSNETDENGVPISGSVHWSVSSVIPASMVSSTSRLLTVRYGGTSYEE